ncbi:MAG TPA: hypothetical protein VGG18_01930 [Granulicella sp.]
MAGEQIGGAVVFRRHPEAKLKDPRIGGGTQAKRNANTGIVSLCVRGGTDAGVLRLRLRMTAKNKQRQRQKQRPKQKQRQQQQQRQQQIPCGNDKKKSNSETKNPLMYLWILKLLWPEIRSGNFEASSSVETFR